MAYSTTNSTAVSVTNFGVKLDGVTDNRESLQRAVDSLYPKGGGTLYFPAGTCYWSGTVNITGQNIRWMGDGDAVLRAAPNEAAKKINVSGGRNIGFHNLLINGGRTGGSSHVSNQYGFISTVNTTNVSVTNCTLYESLNSLIYLGGGTRFANVSDNYFSGHFCGVFSYVNDGEAGSEAFTIQGNRFGWSWCSGDVGESACIKLQSFYGQPGVTRGHVITNNVIDAPMQMGVELWSRGRNSIVANNTIENTYWGISLDGQEGGTVVSNTIRNVSYAGIELASVCRRNTVSANTIDGYISTDTGAVGRRTIYGIVLSNTSCEDNVFSNNTVMGASSYGVYIQNARNTILSNNIIRDNPINLYLHSASLVQCQGNLFDTGVYQTNYHVFFDANNTPISGFHFSDNKFRGRTNQQSIFYYNNGTSNGVFDVCFENNITDSTTSGAYDTFIGGQLTPSNYVYRDNFGPASLNAGNSILDASDTPTPFQPSAVLSAYTYYNTSSWTIPASGVTGDGVWLCIWSGGGGANNVVRVRGYSPSLNDLSGIWGSHVYEATASMGAYEGGFLADSLAVNPSTYYNGDIFAEIHTQKHDTSAITNSVWMKIRPLSSGWSGQQLSFAYSNENLLTGVYATYDPIIWRGGTKGLLLNSENPLLAKYSDGLSINNGSFVYSPRSGTLIISGWDGISLANATEITGYRNLDPILNVTNVGDFVYLDVADFNAPNLSVGNVAYIGVGRERSTNNQFSAGMYYAGAGSSFNRLDFSAYGGSPILSARADSRVGINTTNPSYTLHVNGSFGLSNIATEISANSGAANALPPTPAGYVTINITGAPFKVPYYNI